MDQPFKDLCVAILLERIGGDQFNQLLLKTGICLDSKEWDVANKILEKADEMKCSLGFHLHTVH